jgi:D-tagatose-1,6-bisphosphate aldolase subunit GatZ/KbaZ
MVADGIAILKVGPALSFALREGYFLLSHIEAELHAWRNGPPLPEVIEQVMRLRPEHWKSYYRGTDEEVSFALRYSLSDRARYYWADPVVEKSRAALVANLRSLRIPLSLVSQYFPAQALRVQSGELSIDPEALVMDRIRDVLRGYTFAVR